MSITQVSVVGIEWGQTSFEAHVANLGIKGTQGCSICNPVFNVLVIQMVIGPGFAVSRSKFLHSAEFECSRAGYSQLFRNGKGVESLELQFFHLFKLCHAGVCFRFLWRYMDHGSLFWL